tara:strand:+ start:3949 stop:5352 length:1404 start_codon:yes stop_codon:yes gene_type:complete
MKLHWKIILGMILGIVWSIVSAKMGWSAFTNDWIAPFGKIFVNLLKLIALPLVLFSVIGGVTGIGDPERLGKLGLRTLGLYLLTTIFAVSLGLVLVNVFQPGKSLNSETRLENRINYELWAKAESIPLKDELCFSCKEENLALVNKVQQQMDVNQVSVKVSDKLNTANKTLNAGPLQALVDVVPNNIFASLSNGSMLPIIFFAIFFGIAVLYIPKKESELVIGFINAINEVFLKMIDFVMKISPFFVFALMAGLITSMAGDDLGKMLDIFVGLSYYSFVVVLGLGIMVFGLYPLLIKLISKKYGYFEFFRKIAPAQMLAFSTSSSAATLPITIECVEENLKIDKKISGFVLPIGATVNMDGTSLYQAVAAIFLAQIFMVDLSLGQQLTIVVTATLASIGSAAVPSAGLVMLMIVLSSVGLNPAWIAFVLPVDRLLDMCRTTVNVTGDATICTLIDKFEQSYKKHSKS